MTKFSNKERARALELHRQGCETWQVAQRMGMSVDYVKSIVSQANRKAKQEPDAEEQE